MRHRKTYMYLNFEQTQVSKLYKFTTTNNNFEKNDYFRHASSCNVHEYQLSVKSG